MGFGFESEAKVYSRIKAGEQEHYKGHEDTGQSEQRVCAVLVSSFTDGRDVRSAILGVINEDLEAGYIEGWTVLERAGNVGLEPWTDTVSSVLGVSSSIACLGDGGGSG
jgi:hypothetical protein